MDIFDIALAKALSGNESGSGSGGGGEVKFYPDVIRVIHVGGVLTPSVGEQITVSQPADVGTYAIIQRYYNSNGRDMYGKRTLTKCIAIEKTETEISVDAAGECYAAMMPSVGSTIDIWTGAMGAIGDNIALHIYNGGGESKNYFGWVLAELTNLEAGAHHYFKILSMLPDDYDGTLGTQTLTVQTSTLEVIAILDTVAPHEPVLLYRHSIRIYETVNYFYDLHIQFVSTKQDYVYDKDGLVNLLELMGGSDDFVCCTGYFNPDGGTTLYIPSHISRNGSGHFVVHSYRAGSVETSDYTLFQVNHTVEISDTVTPL